MSIEKWTSVRHGRLVRDENGMVTYVGVRYQREY